MTDTVTRTNGSNWRIAPYFMVDDVVATANFYRDKLGFDYERFWGEPASFCMVYRDGVIIMLRKSSAYSDSEVPCARYSHLSCSRQLSNPNSQSWCPPSTCLRNIWRHRTHPQASNSRRAVIGIARVSCTLSISLTM